MKKFLFSFVALFCVTISFAQSSLLATLSHEGQISTFYGATALREAHSAATHGDIITLSSGTFVSVNITKAITLRGAGMAIDTVHNTLPTVISGDFDINIADSVSQKLTMEGVYSNHSIHYINVNNPVFLKSRFKEIRYYGSTVPSRKIKDALFVHCRIAEGISLYTNCSASLINCIVNYPSSSDSKTSNYEFTNCVVYYANSVMASSYINCVLSNDGYSSYDYLSRSCSAYNNISTCRHSFDNIPNNTNRTVEKIETIFKTYKGGEFKNLDSENFELTDAAKAKYLGSDGTQVGIYGGMLPYNTTPSNPQITKCKVASKSTADGKLSVDIEVKAAE